MKTCHSQLALFICLMYLEAAMLRIRWGSAMKFPPTGCFLHLDVFPQISNGWQSTHICQKNCVKINVKSNKVKTHYKSTLNLSVHIKFTISWFYLNITETTDFTEISDYFKISVPQRSFEGDTCRFCVTLNYMNATYLHTYQPSRHLQLVGLRSSAPMTQMQYKPDTCLTAWEGGGRHPTLQRKWESITESI